MFNAIVKIISVGRPVFDPDPTSSLGDLMTLLGGTVSTVLGWVTSVASTIVGTPLLLMTTSFLIVGGAIGIFGRLLSKN